MKPLRLEETVKALAFLRSRLRADTAANREALAQRHAAMDAGERVRREGLIRTSRRFQTLPL